MAFTPFSNSPGTLNLVAANAALKELYDSQKMINLVYPDHPFLAMVEKREITNAQGKYIPQPVISAPPLGRAANFSAALNNQSALSAQSFFLQRYQNHQIVGIDNETMMATAGDIGSFLTSAKLAIDPAIEYLSRNINSVLFRDGTGQIGQIGTIATGVITLQNPDDVVQFEFGQILVAAATAGGAAFNGGSSAETNAAFTAGGVYCGQVIAVDRSAGTVTVATSAANFASLTPGTPTNWVSGSFLRTLGDVNQNAAGLAGWLPVVAPGAGDSFYQVNRSTDPVRLAGVRYNGSQQSIEEGVIQGLALANREGARPEMLLMNFTSYAALQKSLSSKAIYMGPVQHEIGDVSFEGFKFHSSAGLVTVFADRDCQAKTAYGLTMKHWTLWSLGDVPHIDQLDGNMMLRNPTLDAQQIRVAAYYTLGCEAPGRNIVIQLSE